MTKRWIAAAGAALFLAACGGGYGGGGGTYMVPAPKATATPSGMPAQTAQILGSAGFVSPNLFTLYEFGADTAGVSNCSGACAAVWPPFAASANAQPTGLFTIIVRADGIHQWAYKGHALYNFSGDARPGDAAGDGLNLNGGIWHVARP